MTPRLINVSLPPEQRALLRGSAAQLRVSEAILLDALLVLAAALPPPVHLDVPSKHPGRCEQVVARVLGSGSAACVLLVPEHFPSPGAAIRWALSPDGHLDKLLEYLTQVSEAEELRQDIIRQAEAALDLPKEVPPPCCPTCGR